MTPNMLGAYGETLVVDNGGALLNFVTQAGASAATIAATGEGLKWAGWNPVTQTYWVTDVNNRKIWVIDPIDRVVLERLAMVKALG